MSEAVDIDKPAKRRNLVFFALKAMVSLGLIFYLLYAQVDNVDDIWAAIYSADPVLLLAAFLLHTMGYLLCSWRWQILLKAQGVFVPLIELARAYTIGIFFNSFLPGVMSGDFMRALDISDRLPSYTKSLMILFVERLTGMFGLLVLALGALPLIGWENVIATGIGWVLAFVAVGLFVIYSLFLSPRLQLLIKHFMRLPFVHVFASILTKISETSRIFADRKKPVYICALISVAFQANVVLHFYLIGTALGFDLGLIYYFAIIPVSLFIMIIPASINGIGIREQIFIFLFGYFAVPAAAAVSLAWIALAMVMVQAIVGGILFALRRKAKHMQTV